MKSFVTTEFGPMCRELRVSARLKQREVAARVGIAASTYGNVETNPHKTIRRDRAERLGASYGLCESMMAQLMAAWDAQPTTEYSQRQRESWAVKNARRSKIRNYDKLKLALIEVTTGWVTTAPDPDTLCTCPEVDMFAEPAPDTEPDEQVQSCELCNALQLVGLTGWTTLEDVIAKLAAIQEAMTK